MAVDTPYLYLVMDSIPNSESPESRVGFTKLVMLDETTLELLIR